MDLIQNFYSHFVLTYYGMAFHLMTWTRFWIYTKFTYGLPYITLYIAFYLITVKNVLGVKRQRKEERKEVETKKE